MNQMQGAYYWALDEQRSQDKVTDAWPLAPETWQWLFASSRKEVKKS